jgi:putative transcriptional regulator
VSSIGAFVERADATLRSAGQMSGLLDMMSGSPYSSRVGRTSATGRQNAVRRARQLAELTQAELAAAAGVTRQTIVAVEAGDYAPSVYLALAIAERLGTTVEELFAADGDRERRQR